jgi:V/A-type H+-transporting ATPase subunit I
MFKPARMLNAQLLVPRSKSSVLITALHEKGVCELKEVESKDLGEIEASDSEEITIAQQRLSKLMAGLDEFKPIRQPDSLVKTLFFPSEPKKIKADLFSNQAVLDEVNGHLDVIESKVEKQLVEISEARQKIEEIEISAEELLILPNVNLDLFAPSKNIAVILGIITKKAAIELEPKLKESVFLLKNRDENTQLLILACRQSQRENVEKELHAVGFDPLKINFSNKKPREIIAGLEHEKIALRKRINEIRLYLQNTAKGHWERLEVLEEELSVCVERADALKQARAGKSFAIFEAWLPAANLLEFKQTVRKSVGQYYLALDERDEAPSLLDNPKVLKPFEMITGLYSVPKYKGLDPTPVLAITFALFFGYMLTDFAYGVILTTVAVIIYKGIGKYNPGLRQFAAVLIGLGISTALLGAAFTSYFGDFFPRIGIETPGLLDPLKDVMVIIGLAVVIGVLHISLGLLMGFVDNIMKGKRRDAFANQGVWLLFLIGVVVALLGEPFMMIALGLIAGAVLLHIIFSVLEGGAVIGILSVFDFSGFVGDIFSYARLTALAIGTAGIALAINFMALLVMDMIPVVGIVFAVLIFVVGHLFNMVMNGLGSFIHSLRLHFLEFFQKFYDGGGQVYQPFHAKRKKTMGGI